MDLKSIIADEKVVSVDVAGFEGFKVQVAYMSKSKVRKLIEKATKSEFDQKTRRVAESLDSDLFNELFAKNTIKGWSGLTGKHLSKLVVLSEDIGEEVEIDFSEDNAVYLLKSSEIFDAWLNDVINDIANFN